MHHKSREVGKRQIQTNVPSNIPFILAVLKKKKVTGCFYFMWDNQSVYLNDPNLHKGFDFSNVHSQNIEKRGLCLKIEIFTYPLV